MMASKLPDLTKITKAFGRAYDSADRANTRKTAAQAKFFTALDTTLEAQQRQQKLVNYDGEIAPDLSLTAYVERYYPGWRFVAKSDLAEELLIEEDPKLMKYTFVNPDNSMVYARTVAQSSNSLDDERLRRENPTLWEQITEWPEPWYSLIKDCIWFVGHNEDENILDEKVGNYLTQKGMQRMLKNPDTWTDTELKAVARYMIPGSVSTRLVKPRKANEEELS